MKLVRRRCPLCGSDDESRVIAEQKIDESALDEFAFASRKNPEFMHYRVVMCPRCDLQYSSPVPESSWIRKGYENASFDASEESAFAAGTYIRYLLPYVRKLGRGGRALDIGAGDGAFARELLKAGFDEVTGVEPSRAPFQSARPDIKAHLRNEFFTADRFEQSSMDLVTCFQTLEHVDDPVGLFKSVRTILRPGGVFGIVAHNHRAFSARVMGTGSPIYDIEHLQLFSAPSLRRIFTDTGFGEVAVRGISNIYPLSYWIRLLPLKGKEVLGGLFKALGVASLKIPLRAGNLMAVGVRG